MMEQSSAPSSRLTAAQRQDIQDFQAVTPGILTPADYWMGALEWVARQQEGNFGVIPNVPKNAAEIRDFIGHHFESLEWGQESEQPCDDDRYTLTAHDLLSAFTWSGLHDFQAAYPPA